MNDTIDRKTSLCPACQSAGYELCQVATLKCTSCNHIRAAAYMDPAPAGCQSEPCSEARGAAGDEATTDLTHGSSVRRTKGWVKLERVLRLLEYKATDAADQAAAADRHRGITPRDYYNDFVAAYEGLGAEIAALCAEPGPKSDSEGGERCSRCGGSGYVFSKEDLDHDPCPQCMAP